MIFSACKKAYICRCNIQYCHITKDSILLSLSCNSYQNLIDNYSS